MRNSDVLFTRRGTEFSENQKKKLIMKKIITVLLLQLFTWNYSQYVDIIEKGKLENLTPREFMIPLKNEANYKSSFVAQYKAHYPNTYLGHLFTAIADEAKRSGANAYHVVSFKEADNQNDAELVLDTYYLEDSDIKQQSLWVEKNNVYIIGEPVLNTDKTSKFKVNGEKKEVRDNTFMKITLKESEEVKIVKGGITGMAVWVKWKPEQFSKFYSFSGLGIDGVGFGTNGMGIGINTGRIYPVDPDVGYFLIQVLKESK
ncbi:hypothetical protein CEQ15_13155 [Chryseobacterium indologenes]|nr:hypothetical protein CEQ15_13155 [Chryseobacterium indologenes]